MWYRFLLRGLVLCLVLALSAEAQIGGRGGIGGGGGAGGRGGTTPDMNGTGNTVIRFMPTWTNTNAILIQGGEETVMTAVKNYCGWFQAKTTAPASGFKVRFKQTIGNLYVGTHGIEKVASGALPIGEEITLDTMAAKTDTIWIIANPDTLAPEVYSTYPQRLGECPVKTLSVMMFDWYHGGKGDGGVSTRTRTNRDSTTTTETIYGNGAKDQDPELGGAHPDLLMAYMISNDFGSGGCGGSNTQDKNRKGYMAGMVEPTLGQGNVPTRKGTGFPENCQLTDYLDFWFLPVVIGKDAAGKEYTNATCRDVQLDMTDDGFWLGQKDDQSPEGGFFLLDDFEFLDAANTVRNPMFDQESGHGKRHNFGFTMKVQAKFEYVKGQYFEFFGDDDVWVFINNRLVVDLGGQHQQVFGSVDLDTLGLVEGQEYPFHIFYVERHVSSSNFMMRTSMDLHTESSIFLTGNVVATVKNFDIWQVVKKDALSCDFNANALAEVDTVEGPSNFRLIGGNLGEKGVDLGVGTHYEGITIDPSTARFSIDSTKIVENYALGPGHYELIITLKADPSQSTRVSITVPQYNVPTIVFTDEKKKKVYGKEISGDTLQLGRWAYEMYEVNVKFDEDWAEVTTYNKTLSITMSNPLVGIFDKDGNPISKVTLDSASKSATFYVMANGPVTDATLQVKGAAASTAIWTKLRFDEPPIPHVQLATLYDRNGDGRGDSLHITWDKAFDSQNILTALQVNFGEEHPEQKVKPFNGKTLELTSGACQPDKACGFGSLVFTGSNSGVFTGYMTTYITYRENGKDYHFTIRNEPVSDGVNPIIKSAVKKISDATNHILTLTFSEAITDSVKKYYADMFQYTCVRSGVEAEPIKATSQTAESANMMSIIFVGSSVSQVIPSVGDLVRFTPGNHMTAEDLSKNRAHKNNPWVSITGEQEMTISSAGLVTLDPSNPIVRSDSSTVPKLVTEESKGVEQVAAEYGVQGHLVSFDVGTLISDQTKEEIAELDAFINTLMNSGTFDTTITKMSVSEATKKLIDDIKNDRLGGAYGISEEVLDAIKEGKITADNLTTSPMLSEDDKRAFNELVNTSIANSIDTTITSSLAKYATAEAVFEAIKNGTISTDKLRDAGVSERVINAIKNDKLTASNLDAFRSGDSTLISPEQVHLSYKTHYYSHLGHFVGGQSGMIGCEDPVYKEDDPDANCITNSGKIFLAWNMRSNKGQLAATGVYIARLEFKITIDEEVIKHTTRDFLWGVRRGKENGITLDPTK